MKVLLFNINIVNACLLMLMPVYRLFYSVSCAKYEVEIFSGMVAQAICKRKIIWG